MKTGLIAGGGNLPRHLIDRWLENGTDFVVAGLDGFADAQMVNWSGQMFSLGAAGKIISFLKKADVRDLVIAGKVSRPDFLKIKPDARGIKVIARLLLNKKDGDDALLRMIRTEIEKDGFHIRGVQDYLPELLAPEGSMGRNAPRDADMASIAFGLRASQDHGRRDLGQAVVVQDQSIIGQEDNDGTAALIHRCGILKQSGRGPILVKTCKPQQDRRLDLPTIGPDTARQAAAAGFCGIAIQTGETLVLDRDETAAICDEAGMFLYGSRI